MMYRSVVNILGIFSALFCLTGCQCSSDQVAVVSQKYIHKYGFTVSEKEWVERDQEGKVITCLSNGVTLTENFQEGLLHGITSYTYPYSSQASKEEVYDQGDLLSEKFYDKHGVPITEERYEIDGKRLRTAWDENGAPIYREEYQNDKLLQGVYYNSFNEVEGKVAKGEGLRVIRSRKGDLLYQDLMLNGELQKRTTYHNNGKVHMVVTYVNYKPVGKVEEYTPQGNLHMISCWENGLLHGEKIDFREGKKLRETTYAMGVKEGWENSYDEEGNLIEKAPYFKGKKHGAVSLIKDHKWSSEWFYEGKKVTEEKFQFLEERERALAQLELPIQ